MEAKTIEEEFDPFGEKDQDKEKKDKKKDKKEKKKKKKKKAEPELWNLDGGSLDDFEMCLLSLPECFLYQIPPKQVSTGYKSEAWGLGTPLHTGPIKVMGKGKILYFEFFKDGNLFLKSAELDCSQIGPTPKKPLISFLQPVQDSKRYFVFRVKDPRNNRIVPFGMGFRDREPAFDFNAAIQDKIAQVNRDAEMDKPEEDNNAEETQTDLFTLKGPITVKLKGHDENKPKKTKSTGVAAALGGLTLAPPPPSTDDGDDDDDNGNENGDDDDWGDFSSA